MGSKMLTEGLEQKQMECFGASISFLLLSLISSSSVGHIKKLNGPFWGPWAVALPRID